MRYYVGIDPASESFVVSIFVPPGEELSDVGPREFSNDAEGFELFRAWLTDKDELADALIAATAEFHGAWLVTLNVKHFPMLDDVMVPY